VELKFCIKLAIMNRSLRLGFFIVALIPALAARSADVPAPVPGPSQDELNVLRSNNKQLSEELAAAWKEADKLKAELAAAEAAATATDTGKQIADLQDKLATALKSYSVVQEENDQLKAAAEKAGGDQSSLSQQLDAARSTIASLQPVAAAASQIDPLRTELRQTQDEAARLAADNASLRTRLAIAAPAPGAGRPVPSRPGQVENLPPIATAPAVAPASPPPPPAPVRTYTVADGDTLTRISQKFYGTPNRWNEILDANRAVVKDEKSLPIGASLKIP
jgi:LysM repeat protein